jgi:hypothetical protein
VRYIPIMEHSNDQLYEPILVQLVPCSLRTLEELRWPQASLQEALLELFLGSDEETLESVSAFRYTLLSSYECICLIRLLWVLTVLPHLRCLATASVQRIAIFFWQPASTNGIPSAVKYLYSLHIKRATGQTVSSEMVHSDVNFSVRSRREV